MTPRKRRPALSHLPLRHRGAGQPCRAPQPGESSPVRPRGETGVRLQRVSRVCKEESLQFIGARWLVQYRTGKRPGTITNPECTLDAIFTLLTPGVYIEFAS